MINLNRLKLTERFRTPRRRNDVIFRQLFDPQSSTYTYLLADEHSREAVIIDPVFENLRREIALIEELRITPRYTLETHVHADHVTGAWLLREKLGAQIALSKLSGAEGADLYLSHGDRIPFGRRYFEARATPGHTDGCMTYVLDDLSAAFTGDTLLVRGCGRTDFQHGCPHKLFRSVHEQIFSLPGSCLIYPAHDYSGSTVSSVAEETEYNPRLGRHIREDDFCGFMENLGLPHPKKMDIAMPANLKCGKPETDAQRALDADWAPVKVTYAGIPEIAPQWVAENARKIQLVDVREPDEFNDELGHIAGAKLVPLGQLKDRLGELDKAKPVVAYCRSGARSARATQTLEHNGFSKIANLTGGMLRWRAHGLPVEGATPPG
jgi:glyoxylase-like metal-dependent hydrolase (beta-lactamase superfamily II)/rhodanese-related sulfurtransferase